MNKWMLSMLALSVFVLCAASPAMALSSHNGNAKGVQVLAIRSVNASSIALPHSDDSSGGTDVGPNSGPDGGPDGGGGGDGGPDGGPNG
jgi:hypothetical protein